LSRKLFISHASKDKEASELLLDLLKASLRISDADILYSSRVANGLMPGEDVSEGLRKAVAESQVVLGLISPDTPGSTYTMFELGGAWVREKVLLLSVMRRGHQKTLQPPLNDIQSTSLDDAASVATLIETLQQRLNTPVPKPSEYNDKLEKLQRHVQSNYPAEVSPANKVPLPVTTVEPTRWEFKRIANIVLWVLTAVFALLMQIPFQAQLYSVTENTPLVDVEVFLDGRPAKTDTNGFWTLTVYSLIPRPHKIAVKVPGTERQESTTWFGPWPWYLLNVSPPAYFLDTTRKVGTQLYSQGGEPGSIFGLAYAAEPKAGEAGAGAMVRLFQAAPSRIEDLEIGFFVESVLPRRLPGLFFKTSRGYLRVLSGDTSIDCLATSPMTLGKEQNYFPIKANPKSWLPLKEGQPQKFGQIFCRLPGDFLTTFRADNTMELKSKVSVSLIGSDNTEIDQFDLNGALKSPVDRALNVIGTNKSEVVVRPSLRVNKDRYNLELRPSNLLVNTGTSARLTVTFKNGMTPPFNLQAQVSVESSTASVKLPNTLILPKGRVSTELPLTGITGAGNVRIVLQLPKTVGGSTDDAHLIVQ
jgi:hypothetical protein